MNIEDYWEVEKIFKQIHYHVANGENYFEIQNLYKSVFKICAKYAISEQDRKWLHDKSTDESS